MNRSENGNKVIFMDEEDRMVYVSMPAEGIVRAGYDPQCEVLEIEFAADKSVHRFYNVSEQDWHDFRGAESACRFLQTCIMGRYKSKKPKEIT